MKISKGRNLWFTIAELIVIITILVILATIWYIYLSANLSKSRDSARLADIDNIQSGITLTKVNRWSYPTPDSPATITYSWSNVWSQGLFGIGVIQKLKGFSSKVPTDPLYNNNYTYSITSDSSAFQIGAILENSDDPKTTSFNFWIATTYAAGQEGTYISGNFNWVFTRAKTGSLYLFIATPSIIATDTANTNLAYILANKKISFNGFGNFPSSYKGKLTSPNSLNFSIANPLIYSGSLESLYTYNNLAILNNGIKSVYSGSVLTSNTKYGIFFKSNSVKNVKWILQKNYDYKWEYYLSCQDIQESWAATWANKYTIDPDGRWPWQAYFINCWF